MKQQYLGDSKDAFKWDYLDYLTKKLQSDYLDIIPMITPNDKSGEGKTSSDLFPADDKISQFCKDLKRNGDFGFLRQLPKYTAEQYKVRLHKLECEFVNSENKRRKYFSDISLEQGQIWFFDPDIGFEPLKTPNKKHLKYSDIANIWTRFNKDAVIMIFQHGRRMHTPFGEHYQEIMKSLTNSSVDCHATALFWCSQLMFVVIGKSKIKIEQVQKINARYQQLPRPVQLINL